MTLAPATARGKASRAGTSTTARWAIQQMPKIAFREIRKWTPGGGGLRYVIFGVVLYDFIEEPVDRGQGDWGVVESGKPVAQWVLSYMYKQTHDTGDMLIFSPNKQIKTN